MNLLLDYSIVPYGFDRDKLLLLTTRCTCRKKVILFVTIKVQIIGFQEAFSQIIPSTKIFKALDISSSNFLRGSIFYIFLTYFLRTFILKEFC